MDVFFETSHYEEFSVEIWFFDTVAEIKKKVEKCHGYSVSSQMLTFNGRVLQDHRDTEYYDILQNSRIQLFLSDDFLPPKRRKLTVNIYSTNFMRQLPLVASAAHTICQVKLRIHELEQNIPPDQCALFRGSVELEDSNTLGHYNIADGSEVKLLLRSVAAAAAAALPSSGKMRVVVHINRSGRKIPIEVTPETSVAELRVELSDLDENFNLQLPDEYFFVYKRNAMEEDESLEWYDVKQGDTIDVFQGRNIY